MSIKQSAASKAARGQGAMSMHYGVRCMISCFVSIIIFCNVAAFSFASPPASVVPTQNGTVVKTETERVQPKPVAAPAPSKVSAVAAGVDVAGTVAERVQETAVPKNNGENSNNTGASVNPQLLHADAKALLAIELKMSITEQLQTALEKIDDKMNKSISVLNFLLAGVSLITVILIAYAGISFFRLRSNVSDFRDKADELNQKVTILTKKTVSVNKLKEQATEKIKTLHDEIKRLQEESQAFSQQQEEMEKQLAAGKITLDEITQNRSIAVDAINDLLRKKEQLEDQADQFQKHVEEKTEEVKRYSESMKKNFASSFTDKAQNINPAVPYSQDLEQKAQTGDVNTQFQLGVAYYNGVGVAQDYAKAANWLIKAAEQGHQNAQLIVAEMYYKGEGLIIDKENAAKWYQKAAEQGNVIAQFNLGNMYRTGDGIPENKPEAAKWYQKAAEQGNKDAQFNLGMMLKYGIGIPKNKAEAVKFFRKAAEQGDNDAQVNLGFMLQYGIGIPENKPEAATWYQTAAKQGNVVAKNNLGVLLLVEDAPLKDVQKAFSLFQEAAVSYRRAMLHLAEMYERGYAGVVERSLEKAAEWYRKAAEGEEGEADAMFALGELLQKEPALAADPKEAARWLQLAAEKGVTERYDPARRGEVVEQKSKTDG